MTLAAQIAPVCEAGRRAHLSVLVTHKKSCPRNLVASRSFSALPFYQKETKEINSFEEQFGFQCQ